jgi:adenosine deaminase
VSAIQDHPIKELFARGVFVTLNTDDPTFFNISLLDEYWNLHHELNFSLDDVKRVLVNGFEASFLPPAEKRAYVKKLTEAWETALATVSR